MKRFNWRVLVFVVPIVVMIAIPVLHGLDESDVVDVTVQQSHVCEVHNQAMVQRLVDLKCGVQDTTEVSEARTKLFPHANEEYKMASNCQGKEARIFVCNHCSKARQQWELTQSLPKNLQASR